MALKATPDDQALLLDLQALDTKLAQLDHRAKSLAQHARLVQLATEVDALRQTELEQRGAREDVTIELSRLESDVAVVEARITRDTARAQSSSNAKDVQAFEHELGLLRKRQFDLEEIELTVMERLEERDTELAAATATLASVRAAIAELEAQRDARVGAALERGRQMTFDQCASAYIDALRSSWKNAKHADQWVNTLSSYASPLIGELPVALVDTDLIVKVLSPIWKSKTETAVRLRCFSASPNRSSTLRGQTCRWKDSVRGGRAM